MSIKKYAGEEAVERLSEYIKRKLESVTTMPTNPSSGDIVIYLGDTTNQYTQGDLYKWDVENNTWIKITYNSPEIDNLLGDIGDWEVVEHPTAEQIQLTADNIWGTEV